MDPGLVIWKVTWSESPNGCELRASDGVFLGIFNWTLTRRCIRGFCWEILNGPRIGDLGGNLVGNSEWV